MYIGSIDSHIYLIYAEGRRVRQVLSPLLHHRRHRTLPPPGRRPPPRPAPAHPQQPTPNPHPTPSTGAANPHPHRINPVQETPKAVDLLADDGAEGAILFQLILRGRLQRSEGQTGHAAPLSAGNRRALPAPPHAAAGEQGGVAMPDGPDDPRHRRPLHPAHQQPPPLPAVPGQEHVHPAGRVLRPQHAAERRQLHGRLRNLPQRPPTALLETGQRPHADRRRNHLQIVKQPREGVMKQLPERYPMAVADLIPPACSIFPIIMMNLNLMHINEHYDFPSELHDSSLEHEEEGNIQTEDQYTVQSAEEEEESGRQFEIDHSLDGSSIDHDGFLDMIRQDQRESVHEKTPANRKQEYLMVNRTRVELTLLQTQSAKETVTFTNPTSHAIRMRFNECPFPIQSDKTLNYVLAEQLQLVVQPWQRLDLTFLIKPRTEEYGDIIDIAVVTAEFLNRAEDIAPVNIQFHIHYVMPKLRLKFEGNSQVVSTVGSKMPVSRIKANKIGEYILEIGLMEGVPKMEATIESRGKAVSSMQTICLLEGEFARLKLRPRGRPHDKQKSALILRARESKLCYVFGLQLL